MSKENFGDTCTETLNAVYMTTINPLYLKLTSYEKNLMKWAALLHNIGNE